MKKKLLSIALASVMVLSMAGCGSTASTPASGEASVSTQTSVSTEETTETKTETSTEVSTETETSVSAETENTQEPAVMKSKYLFTDRTGFIPSNAATDFVANLTIGWNLGNTFDANDGSNGLQYETYWQKDKTTPELIQALKDAGFNTIRIPVSWHNHIDSNNQIDEAWLNRVQEVVDYCMDCDMYVILNTHHDISKFFIYPSNQYRDQSNKFLADIWSQVAERFKDYDEKLMFESMNETRLVGNSAYEWYLNPGAPECIEAVDCINDYNKTFVETVRKSGGNNETRFLVIPGYCTSPDGITNGNFVIPEDPNNEDPHMILTVHSYAPYDFALNISGTKEWSHKKSGDTKPLDDMMFALYAKYVKNGIPVIFDEMGCLDKGGNTESRADNASYFVGLARNYGMPCVWWDNNNRTSSGERFTIIDRKTMEIIEPEIVNGMMNEIYAGR